MVIVERWAARSSTDGPIVVLDRDGVVVENVPDESASPTGPPLIPGAVEALSVLSECGARVVVVTNQARVGRGLIPLDEAIGVTRNVLLRLDPDRTMISGFSLCPHAPRDGCDCRKPQVGGVQALLRLLEWSEVPRWFIGDKLTDVECGNRLGASSVLVRTGHGEKESLGALSGGPRPELYVTDVLEAATQIARISGTSQR